MIPIKKSAEPRTLTEYRLDHSKCTPTFREMPPDVKQTVYDQLMNDQGHLCAYCMCRISLKDKKHNPPVRIEHIDPQSLTDESEALKYKNMLAVCSGNESPASKEMLKLHEERLTCDAHRHNAPLVVNPLIPHTLSTIKYRSNGIIYSDNPDVNKDLNVTLNLNCKAIQLPQSRKAAKDKLIETVSKLKKGDITTYAQRTLDRWDTASNKPPYVGIMIAWLKKHIR